MREILQRPVRRKKAATRTATTATEEYLDEVEQTGHEEDTDTAAPGGGSGDPITPSPQANRNTAEGHPSNPDESSRPQ
ncbi:hypothetical protein ABT009_32085 [Streptomyces sp. NPDC002896]|uniref:hypothetical protein n=1 Tax=Streptomyces sp. NPDC002896 TaxID=3154438 RepID=UPI003327A6FA